MWFGRGQYLLMPLIISLSFLQSNDEMSECETGEYMLLNYNAVVCVCVCVCVLALLPFI